uniref:TIDP2936 n=1 Tax=Arundo donax TaxID=35708 RepID=A0A0A9BJ30_ARUDO
MNKRFLKQF